MGTNTPWDVWTGRQPRAVDWQRIANDWQGVVAEKDVSERTVDGA
jgi:hypothetical protein